MKHNDSVQKLLTTETKVTGIHIYCLMIWLFVKLIFFLLKQVRIGNRSYLSKIDIQQVNMMYKCNGGGGGNPPPPPPGKKIMTYKASE